MVRTQRNTNYLCVFLVFPILFPFKTIQSSNFFPAQDATSVPWIPLDVASDAHVDVGSRHGTRFPDFAEFGAALAVEVSVKERELLYLPAMWYHRVAQKGVSWHERIKCEGCRWYGRIECY